MNLSNRLTFSLVFSVLLVAAIPFVAAPADGRGYGNLHLPREPMRMLLKLLKMVSG